MPPAFSGAVEHHPGALNPLQLFINKMIEQF